MHLLAIGAHPDDCELFAGGLLASLAGAGYRVAICDLTRGEAASRGSPEERAREAAGAAAILGVSERVALDLGDAGLENTLEARRAVVEVLRKLRPDAILTHHENDRHPDHARASRLVSEARFYATVGGFAAKGERLERLPALFYFFGNPPGQEFQADIIVPIDATREKKWRAIAAYRSQFHNPDYDGAPTMISSREYAEAMEARERLFGQAIGAQWGEPYALAEAPGVADPLGQLFGIALRETK